jgi:molybdenum cofactor cytidylyltransferase
MQLSLGLRLRPGQLVSFVGAGGKSGAIARLADELCADAPVLITTSTKLHASQISLGKEHILLRSDGDLDQVKSCLAVGGTCLVTGGPAREADKLRGPESALLEDVIEVARSSGAYILVEADGARGRAIKAPAPHEPQIPLGSDLVVPVVGLGALDSPLNAHNAHRAEIVADLTGLDPGAPIKEEHVARLLTSSAGALKDVPPGVEMRALLNQADTPSLVERGEKIAANVLENRRLRAVCIASLRSDSPLKRVQGRVAGIVLAAGGSSRLDRPKQLVEWRGEPLVRHAARAVLGGGCDPVVVVLGAGAEVVGAALNGLEVDRLLNVDWESGLSSSLRAGLAACEAEIEAALFVLADMPLVDGRLVRALMEEHALTLATIVATRAGGQLTNPALFDRRTFPDLHEVRGDVGGRELFQRYPVHGVSWEAQVLFDLDTPEDLSKLRRIS